MINIVRSRGRVRVHTCHPLPEYSFRFEHSEVTSDPEKDVVLTGLDSRGRECRLVIKRSTGVTWIEAQRGGRWQWAYSITNDDRQGLIGDIKKQMGVVFGRKTEVGSE